MEIDLDKLLEIVEETTVRQEEIEELKRRLKDSERKFVEEFSMQSRLDDLLLNKRYTI